MPSLSGRSLRRRLILLGAMVLLAGCGGSGGGSGDEPDPVGAARLSFQVNFRGNDLADATVTLLDPAGQEIPGFAAQTSEVGYVPPTTVEGLPEDGFIARACVPKPGSGEVQCLYSRWDRRPQAVALVKVDDVTTLAYDPDFKTCDWVRGEGARPRSGCEYGPESNTIRNFPAVDSLIEKNSDPGNGIENINNNKNIYNRNIYVPEYRVIDNITNKKAIQPMSSWNESPKSGLSPSLIPQMMLTSVVSNLTGMGINFLLGKLFPREDYSALAFRQLTLLTDLVSKFQDEVRDEFNTLTHQLDQEYVDLQLPKLQTQMLVISGASTSLLGYLAQAVTSSTDPVIRAQAQANLLNDLRGSYLKPNIIDRYSDLIKARSDIANIAPKLFEYFSYADEPWTKDRKRLGLASAQYSTNLYKLYLSIMAALAQMEDLDNRLLVYSMTMVDGTSGQVCQCENAAKQPCVGTFDPQCLNVADGTRCDAHCLRVSPLFPQGPTNLDVTYPLAPNPVTAFYEPIYRSIRTSFLAALGKGVPGFLVMEDAEHRLSMYAPYLARPKSQAEFMSHQAALDAGDLESVIWNVDLVADDPNGTIVRSNLAAMAEYDDWKVGRYNPDHYVVNYFIQLGSTSARPLRGIDVLGRYGVRVGKSPVSGSETLFAAYSSYGGTSVSLFGYTIDDGWRRFYPDHIRCYPPIEVHWPSGFFGQNCNASSQEVVASWFRNCFTSGNSDLCTTYDYARCSGFPEPDDETTFINRADYDAALPFCSKSQYGNHDWDLTSFHPAAGGVGTDHPTSIGRTWREFPQWVTADGIPASDTTIATNITPIMWCPDTQGGEAFIHVSLRTLPGTSETAAVCTYADGSEAVFDPGLNGFVEIEQALGSTRAEIAPYHAGSWQGTTCENVEASRCRFLLLNPTSYSKVVAG